MEDTIDLGYGIRKVWKRRRLFYKALPIAFVLASALILCVPRTYTASSKLAPELSNGLSSMGGLSSLASSFGLDLGSAVTDDAISPLLYPDLMEDNGFIMSLLNIEVRSCDGDIRASYFDYLDKEQSHPWWWYIGRWFRRIMPKPRAIEVKGHVGEKDPYLVSKKEDRIMEQVRDDITLSVDKQTGVITITTKAQDPLVSKMLADSVTVRLQHFITEYRTNKARIDMEYYERLTREARKEYDDACEVYSRFYDSNNDIVLQSLRSKQTDLENDMQIKYTTYTTMLTQLQAAKAKVQEKTPAFTRLQGAQLPLKASGPKRVLFVLGMLILTGFGCILYILWSDIKGFLLKSQQDIERADELHSEDNC